MTKKDYELIANCINYSLVRGWITVDSSYFMARYFAVALLATNPRFDRNKFLMACGAETTQERQPREEYEEV